MAKTPAINRNRLGVIITAVILLLLGAIYFFVYLPANEKTVQERRFSSLQKIDSNIRSKVNNSAEFISNFLNSPNTQDDANKLNSYLKTNSGDNFTLLYNPIIPSLDGKSKKDNSTNNTNIAVSDTSVIIRIDTSNTSITLFKKKTFKSDSITIGMKYDFDKFISPLLPDNVFDQYVVFYHSHKLYETFPSGLNFKIKDSLLEVTNKVSSPGVKTLKIGGSEYKAFSQPIGLSNKNNLLIVGLVRNESYQQEKDQLPTAAVLLLLTILIGLVVCLPWIKLYNMGNKDKLTVKDAVETILVSMVLMSLMFFTFFKYGPSLKKDNDKISRDTLASRVSNSFEKELNMAYGLLNSCDSLYTSSKSYPKKTQFIGDNIKLLANSKSHPKKTQFTGDSTKWETHTDYYKLLNKYAEKRAVNQVYWVDSNGIVKDYLTQNSPIPDSSNVSSRNYFIKTINYQPNHIQLPQFYLDQVVSHTSNTFTSIIAKSSLKSAIPVAILSFTAKSLDKVVMPDGYLYAVIDDKGNVLYHSLANHNLNENLIQEFGEKSEILAAVEAKTDADFTTEYLGRQFNLKIKPFRYLPYFVVVFEDKEYSDTRDTEAYFFTFSMLLCLLIFLIVTFGIVFFASAKRSLFKKQLFDTSWIGPKIPSHHVYNLATIGNLTIIFTMVGYFFFCSFLLYLYILLVSIIYSSILLNGLFARKYKKSDRYLYKFKKIALGCQLAFGVFVNLLACFTIGWSLHLVWLFLYELLSAFLFVCFYNHGETILDQTYSLINLIGRLIVKACNYLFKPYRSNTTIYIPWTYTHSFALMAVTRLIIISGIPVAFFFIFSYNYEQNLDARYKQLLFARSLSGKIDHLANEGEDEIRRLDSKSAYTAGIYTDSHFINRLQGPANKGRDTIYDSEELFTAKILNVFRLHLNSVEIKNNDMNKASAGTEAYFNYPIYRIFLPWLSTQTSYHLSGTEKYLRLSSADLSYSYPSGYLFIIFLFLILIFFYLVHTIIRKLFALNLPLNDSWQAMDNMLIEDNVLNSLLFIVGSPGSGKLGKLKDKIAEGKLHGRNNIKLTLGIDAAKGNVFVADMILISAENGEDDPEWKRCKKESLKDYELVIINHFEYNVKDISTNRIKLNFLEALMHKGTSKIIIISTIHPVSFLDSFNSGNTDAQDPIPQNELERWHVLLGHFRIIIEPLIKSDTPANARLLKKMIIEETQYSHFLNKMQQMALSNVRRKKHEDIGPVSDSMVFKLQLTSQYFYTYIWQSLTMEEKFLLYDLAEDGLVNPYDDHNLSILIYKGLIVNPHGTLMIFNKGFRNFILTSIGTREANLIKEQVKDNGSWGSLKTPLNLIVLAILFFLLLSQQESYSRIITYITAIGTGFTAILKIFPLLGSGNTQKTK